MSAIKFEIPNLAGGTRRGTDPAALEDNELADALNFLPWGATGGAQKVKVWHKDLLNLGPAIADDRIFTDDPVIPAGTTNLELADPRLPRFDNIGKVHYFYSNNFDDGATNYGAPTSTPNVPLDVDTEADPETWTPKYTFTEPQGAATIKAGLYLYSDVVVTDSKRLIVSVPVRQNGAYGATHEATAELFFIDGTAVDTIQVAYGSVDLKEDGAIGRLAFEFQGVTAREVLDAGEYYVEITQDTATPDVDGYSFLTPTTYATGTNAKRFGWAEIPARVTGEAVTNGELSYGASSVFTATIAHTFTNTPAIEPSYTGTLVIQAQATGYQFGSAVTQTIKSSLSLNFGTGAAAWVIPAWNGATLYLQYAVVERSGGYYALQAASNTGSDPLGGSPWIQIEQPGVVSADVDGAVFSVTLDNVADSSTSFIAVTSNAVTASYFHHSLTTLGELIVYQPAETDQSFAAQASTIYHGTRYTKKNAGMPAAADVRTGEEMDVWAFSDKHALFMLYQTVAFDDAETDERVFEGAMFNTLSQYTKWRSAAGAESTYAIEYYLPKFIGEVNCFVNHQQRMVFGGVGGIAIFDPKNLLEAEQAGKVYTPWRDIIIPDINQRKDSQYLIDAGEATYNVHPPVIIAMMVYGEQPGRVVAFTEDYLFVQGGDVANSGVTPGTVNDVWEWQAIAAAQLGDGVGKISNCLAFDGRGLIFDRKGDVYSLQGVPPIDWTQGLNTLRLQKERHLGDDKRAIIVEQCVDTGLGYFFIKDQFGNLYQCDGALVPKPFGQDVTVSIDGEAVNIQATSIRWDARDRRLWIHTDGYEARAYYADAGNTFTPVEVPAGSFVWDADTNSFWPVRNPLDEEDRTGKAAVFRDGNVSWSCGYYFDSEANEYTFYLECDIAGKDPLPLHNSAEALSQPENSAMHATESTAFLLSKLFLTEDHAVQLRYLQSLARLIDGSDCTIYAVSEGVETALGSFSTSTDFSALAHKLASKTLHRSKKYKGVQFKIEITNAYADVIRNFTAMADLAGVIRG